MQCVISTILALADLSMTLLDESVVRPERNISSAPCPGRNRIPSRQTLLVGRLYVLAETEAN